jgi:hypothetical protein
MFGIHRAGVLHRTVFRILIRWSFVFLLYAHGRYEDVCFGDNGFSQR